MTMPRSYLPSAPANDADDGYYGPDDQSTPGGDAVEWEAPNIDEAETFQAIDPSYVPDGFEDQEAFLEYARCLRKDDISADRENRDAGLDDLKFLALDQWDPEVRRVREESGKPCVTVNVLNQFVAQVNGDRRLNETSILVAPKLDATIQMAEARGGLIKNIEEMSRADRVYDEFCEDIVACGTSNMRVNLDYADDDAFVQDIFIKKIPNPFAVVWDFMSVDITGRDARHCFVDDLLPANEYKRQFPSARDPAQMEMDISATRVGWYEANTVTVSEFWEMRTKPAVMALMQDGSTKDVTGQDVNGMIQSGQIVSHPVTGKPVIRVGRKKYARMHLITGWEILAGPYELPIDRLPIIRGTGREVRVGNQRIRFGLVRWAKDAQRMKNYWRSVAVEKLAMSPRAVWTAEAGSVEGREDDWRTAHFNGDPLLLFNDGKNAPTRVLPPPLDQAILNETTMNQQDIKDTTGLQDASLGIRSNEVSGVAIMNRQREGDVATIIYHDNTNAGILEAGDVVNQLLGVAYDTVRTLRVIGTDGQQKLMTFNDPTDPNSVDLSAGRFQVSIQTGPSATTQREAAANSMLEAIKVFPQLMEVAGDLIVEAQDWPEAERIAQRLKNAMQPQVLGSDAPQPDPQQAAIAAAQAAQKQELEQEQLNNQRQMAQLQLVEQQAKIQESTAKARKANADADRSEAEADKAHIETKAHAAMRAADVLGLNLPDSGEPIAAPKATSGPPRGSRRPAQPAAIGNLNGGKQ